MEGGTEKRFVDLSDGAYLYSEFSGKSGSPIVLIPGFCCTTVFFQRNVEVLAREHRVVVYDPRGQGNSSKGLQGHTVARNALDLKELIEAYGFESVTVVAWSMAGQFVMDYVRQFGTEHLGAIVFADCPLHALGDEPWNAHGLRAANMNHFNDHLKCSYDEWGDYCAGFARKIWDEVDPSCVEWSTGEFLKTPPWIAFAIYSDMVYRNGFPYLAQADVPMLFTGANSRVTENGVELATKWYPGARPEPLVSRSCAFDEGGHVFFYAESERFNQELLQFIDEFLAPVSTY